MLVAVGVALAAAVLTAEARAADTISFGEQGTSATFAANAIVRIDGSITSRADCPEPGIDDFFYPATDAYLVEAGSTSAELHDAGGGRPNTIVATTSFFIEEVIAVTAPAGSLDEGTYDVVYDTCQDGQFDALWDTVFPSAVTVTLPDVLPLADAAIRGMKDEARTEYASWLATRQHMDKIFRLADRALKAQCKLGNPIGCAMRRLDYFDGVKEDFLALLLSQANHYLAIADDPPDGNYETLTRLAPVTVPHDRNDSALGTSIADALRPLAGEAAVNAALLRAVERYQGAQAAGDAEWALAHARQARNLAATLQRIVPATGDALADLRTTVGGGAELDAALSGARAFVSRVANSGFTADEWRTLRNQGRTAAQIAELESELRGDAADANVTSATVLAALDQARAAHTATAVALAAASNEWDEIVAALEAGPAVPEAGPAIDAGGPYSASEGASFTLAGSATGAIGSAAWDLDADGSFDDATGLEPSASFAQAGAYVVGLRVTGSGHEAVSYAVVRISEANRAPVLSSPVPAQRSATVVVGDPRTFSIDANDPDGDPVAYAWKIDGADAGETGSSLTFSATGAQVGVHTVEVAASDGTTSGGSTRRAWEVVVLARDGDDDGWTATTDCDEADPAVHPTANELLGNGVDDDCDTSTPDAPPGGLTGSMWSWGSNHNGTIGIGSFTPTLVPAPVGIPGYDDVVRIASGSATGYAVLASGEVRAWGSNGVGELGIGTNGSAQSTPVSPLQVGGGSGRLAGIAQLAAGHLGHVVARRVDGSVVTWGNNQSRQGGDGSTVNYRLFPVQVLAAAGGPPVTGVREVEAGAVENYALMADGTVRAWGQIRCDGGSSIRTEPFPVPLPLVGGGVRQISSGNQWTLILKKDGTVLSCGANPPVAGRPVAPGESYVPRPVTGLGPGSGVVDVSAGFEGGLALKADGTVWAWGYNANGSLNVVGIPGGSSAPAPLQVPLPPGPPVVDIEMDEACHALALRADGSVLAWGCDFFEQVGNGPGPLSGVSTPTVVSMPGASAVGIAASVWNSLVLTRPVADPDWERPATWVDASVADATVGEGGGGRFALNLSAALPHDVTVAWSLVEGTAGSTDVTLGDGTATVPAGALTVEVPVPVVDDALDEDGETFTIVLRGASHGIRLAGSQATGTIYDDDEPPAISIEPASIAEGDTSLTDATLSVRLSRPSGKPVAVAVETADGGATTPADYAAASGRLVFTPGQEQAVVHVAVRGDAVAEPDETLSLSLSAPENATLGEASGALTITDDEPLVLAVGSPAVPEGNGGATPVTFTVTLEPAPPAGTTVSVDYELEGVTANVPGDVTATDGTLAFGPAEGEKQVTVEVHGDLTPEPDEVFRLVLSNPAASDGRLVLPGESSFGTILNDDTSNKAPVAADDALATDEDAALLVAGADLRANDSDPDDDTLTVSAVAEAEHGTVVLADGMVTFTPAANYHGPASFTYTISDGRGGSDTAIVAVTVRPVNDPPNAADDVLTTPQDSPGSTNVLANDSDADGDVLAVIDSTEGAHGTADCASTGSCTYTPASGFSGSDSFSYTASDGKGGSVTARVVVTVTPRDEPFFLLIDGDSIGRGVAPNKFSSSAVNDGIARIGLRALLPAFSGANVGNTLTLYSGEVGDEGWFAPKTIPSSWTAAGPTGDGLRNFVLAGPGLGTPDAAGNREALLDKIPDVTPLRASGLKLLEGSRICAVVYKSDVSVNYQPLNASLKGDNLGRVALEVASVARRTHAGASALPQLEVELLDAETVCGGPLRRLSAAPAPTSSSLPFDVTP